MAVRSTWLLGATVVYILVTWWISSPQPFRTRGLDVINRFQKTSFVSLCQQTKSSLCVFRCPHSTIVLARVCVVGVWECVWV